MKPETTKIFGGLEGLFNMKHPARNLILMIPFMVISIILKVGIVAQEQITQGEIFQVWVWAITIFLLIGFIVIAIFHLEGIFALIGGIMGLMILAPIRFFQPQIMVWMVLIGLIGYILFNIKKSKDKSHKK